MNKVSVICLLILLFEGRTQNAGSLSPSTPTQSKGSSETESYSDPSAYDQQTESHSQYSSSQGSSSVEPPHDSLPLKSSQDLPVYKVGEPIEGSQHGPQNMEYYQLNVGDLSKKYLFFSVQGNEKDDWQHIQLKITHKDSKEVLVKCEGKNGKDDCYIDSSKFKPNDILDVRVECEESCDYTFHSKWSNLQHLSINTQTVFHFGQVLEQLYHVELDTEGAFDELHIILKPRATSQIIENLKIYGKYGTDEMPTPTNFDFESVNLWNDGEGLFLRRKDMSLSKFSLLITGQAQTTYVLRVDKIVDGVHKIEHGYSTDDMIRKGGNKMYHIASLPASDDEISIRFSTMVGQPKLLYFKDAEKKNTYASVQYEFMRDSEVLLNKLEAKAIPDGLYLSVECLTEDCAFVIHTETRNFTLVKLYEHMYSFLKMGTGGKLATIQFLEWTGQNEDVSNLDVKVSVFVVNVNGVVSPVFYTCESDVQSCAEGLNRNEIKARSVNAIGMRHNYQIDINTLAMNRMTSVEKRGVILVQFKCVPQAGASECLAAAEYSNGNKITTLRERRPIEDKIVSGDVRYYKYTNQIKDAIEIIININTISGHVVPQGYMKDSNGVEQEVSVSEGNGLKFSSLHLKDVLVTLTTDTTAVYTLSMHVVRRHNIATNVILMSEDVSYSIGIPPQQSAIFEVVPIYNQFFFKFFSSLSLQACILDQTTMKCRADQEQVAKATEGLLKLKDGNARHHKVQLHNSFDNVTAQVTSIFHSAYFQHCEMRKMGKASVEVITDKSCLSYDFDAIEPIDIYLSKRSYMYLGVVLMVCGVPQAMPSSRITLDKKTISKHCQGKASKGISLIWTVHTPPKATAPIKVKTHVVVQHSDTGLILPEGISYTIKKKASDKPLNTFLYEVINKKVTKVVLTQEKGRFRIYAKVISNTERTSAVVNSVDYEYQDDCNLGFMCEPTIQVQEDRLNKCVDCYILVAVYAEIDSQEEVEADIQFTQHIQTLDERKAVVRFLEANSQAYYTYYNPINHQSIVLLLADHNHNCATLYLDKNQYPSPKSYLVKSEQNEIVYPNADEGKYYVMVVAHKACSYSLSVETSSEPIGELQSSKPASLSLQPNQVKYFVVAQLRNTPFKILARVKYGEVQLYSNRSLVIGSTPLTPLNLDYSRFQYVSEHRNVLTLNNKSQGYCSKCHLLIAVKSMVKTEAVLQLVYPTTPIALVNTKVLYDTLINPGDVTVAYYQQIENTNFLFTVYKGEVQVEITVSHKKFEKTFTSGVEKQEMKVVLSSDEKIMKTPMKVVLTAKGSDTAYSLELRSLEEGVNKDNVQSMILRTGEPNRALLTTKKGQCYSGFIRHLAQSFIISTYAPFASYLQGLMIEVSVNKVKAVPEIVAMKNVVLLGLKIKSQDLGSPIEVCMQINGSKVDALAWQSDNEKVLPIVFTQNDQVTNIAADVLYPIESTTAFVIPSDTEFLLDVMQCDGQSTISVAGNSVELATAPKKKLSQLVFSKQTHALKVQHEEPTFFKIEGGMTMARYMPMNAITEAGMGYMNYDIGDLAYVSKFKELRIYFEGVTNVKATKAKLLYIVYTLYITENVIEGQGMAKCGLTSHNPHLVYSIANITSLEKQISYSISKEHLLSVFGKSENIHLLLVADMVLELPQSNKQEHYKLIYSQQQVPREAYTMASLESMHYGIIAAVLTAASALFLVAMILLIKKVLPMIAKLRNSNGLAEDQDQEDRVEEVPQSSDRNGAAIMTALIDGQVSDR